MIRNNFMNDSIANFQDQTFDCSSQNKTSNDLDKGKRSPIIMQRRGTLINIPTEHMSQGGSVLSIRQEIKSNAVVSGEKNSQYKKHQSGGYNLKQQLILEQS